MRKACIRELPDKSLFMSLNRFFYVLGRVKDSSYQIQSTIERQGTVHFEVFTPQNLLAFTDEANKVVSFHHVSDFFDKTNSNVLPKALHQQ